jgi:signal transduction histidine kinase
MQTTKTLKLDNLKLQPNLLRSVAKMTSLVSIAISLAGIVLNQSFTASFFPLLGIVYSALGNKIQEKQASQRVGWLFLFIGFNAAFTSLFYSYVTFNPNFLAGNPTLLYFGRALGDMIWWPVLVLPITLVILYFPDGKLISAKWRLAVIATLVGLAAGMLTAFHSEPILMWETTESLAMNDRDLFLESLAKVSVPLIGIGFLGGIASVIVKYRRSQGVEREQIKWLVYGVAAVIVINSLQKMVAPLFLEAERLRSFNDLSGEFVSLIIPIACGVAIIRHRLWDIDIVINRTLVYGGLSAMIIAAYVLIVSGLGLLFQSENNVFSGLVAAGVIAVVFQPLRARLQQAVNRMLFGEREDPATVLSQLAQKSERAENSNSVLDDLVRSIAELLKIPYVAIRIKREGRQKESIAAWGRPAGQVKNIALRFQGKRIGDLVVAPRGPKDKFTESEEDLLATIAASTATTIRATQLSAELRVSRQRIVSAREEERRRIRRDLHDGLGPQLASQVLGLEAVDQLMDKDPEKAQSLLDSLKSQSKDAILDVRRLVYDLRPPALDDLGLAGALEQSASRYEGSQLSFSIDSPENLPELPAAVETAAFRIAQEAMTNVVRHAKASESTIRLLWDADYLIVEVEDNGNGLEADHRAGVGLQAMRERSKELNGDFVLRSIPTGGTLVQAKLPIRISSD